MNEQESVRPTLEEYKADLARFIDAMDEKYPEYATIAAGASMLDLSSGNEEPETSDNAIAFDIAIDGTTGDVERGIALGGLIGSILPIAYSEAKEENDVYGTVCHAIATGIAEICADDSDAVVSGIGLQIVASGLGLPPLEEEEEPSSEEASESE